MLLLTMCLFATPPPSGMVWVPGGSFTMGSDHRAARVDEQPPHRVQVDGFWMDETEVTNAQFRAFVDATRYVTTAQRPIVWAELAAQLPPGTPKPPDDQLVPGSAVFTPPSEAVNRTQYLQWWRWVPKANWQQPEGPDSTLEGRDNYPVVHVSWDDAMAYASWAGKQLPTEAQWERAARIDHDGAIYAWGERLLPDDVHQANIWQGEFPYSNTAKDGHTTAAPVKSYPPNSLGLYELCGNVWEWTADLYRPDTHRRRNGNATACSNPSGPETAFDPRTPHASMVRVQKGGSFLCHDSYCTSYRPSARMAATPDSTLNHTGFRCIMVAPAPTTD
ncbi:MAG TPA: formylglycine-generating enzyme family protein [Phycisphaerales bacterium]|jgi:formylglycine-generating enzyme required for sulfatase activity|nr:formylglycine-generating enzyme family protein [Phycisphaerales bacterium]